MAKKKIRLKEEAISEILFAGTHSESGAEASNAGKKFEEEEEKHHQHHHQQ
jgi:hypothetical protein